MEMGPQKAVAVVSLAVLLLLCGPDMVDARGLLEDSCSNATSRCSVPLEEGGCKCDAACACLPDYHIVYRPDRKSWLIFPAPLSTFVIARTRCIEERADLVSVSSPEENFELFNAARSFGANRFWIGLVSKTGRRTRNKTEWMWLSTGETPNFDGWSVLRGGQPDNSQGEEGLVARMQHDAAWDDYGASGVDGPKLSFVCGRVD